MLILVITAGDFEPDRFLEDGLERTDMAVGGPQLQFGITGRAQTGEVVIVTRIHVDAGQSLRMTPVQPLRQPDDGGENADGPA